MPVRHCRHALPETHLSTPEVEEVTGVNRNCIRVLEASNQFPQHIRINLKAGATARKLYLKSEVLQWIAARSGR
jgi:predicted DNA-binding transcriptional regulator AlpA